MTEHVARHYTHGSLLDQIAAGIAAIGKNPGTVTIDDLAPADEFHIGGREASKDFLGRLELGNEDHVLDVGCGIGGTSRFVAGSYGCKVTGIDLTPEFIETGRTLCEWVGLDDRVELHCGSALDMPFENETFDSAFLFHVGMNISNKDALFGEVYRLLRSGAVFAIYDVMKTGEGEIAYPVPWATTEVQSALATQAQYVAALQQAGFEIEAVRNRREFAEDFFAEVSRRMSATGSTPPPLGVHIAMGENAREKIANMVDNLAAGRYAPVEIIARHA